jgi:hypothetical protein
MSRSAQCQIGEHMLRVDAHSRITAERTAELRTHLQSCAACHARFAHDLDLIETLARVPTASPPRWRPPRSRWQLALPIAAAAILLVLAQFSGPRPARSVRAAPIPAVFELIERRFQLGGTAAQYVITTTYHTTINCKP